MYKHKSLPLLVLLSLMILSGCNEYGVYKVTPGGISTTSLNLTLGNRLDAFPNEVRASGKPFLLSNGSIIFFGDYDVSVRMYNPSGNSGNGKLTKLTDTSINREQHTITQLPNDTFVIIGGITTGNVVLDSVELYDPNGNSGAGSTTPLASLSDARWVHSAALIRSGVHQGKILVNGGTSPANTQVGTFELYDPASGGSTSLMATMAPSHTGYKSFALSTGDVLLYYPNIPPVLYSPAGNSGAGSYTTLNGGATPIDRQWSSATVLTSDDKLIVAGGYDGSAPITTVEKIDPAANSGTGDTITLTPLPRAANYSKMTQLSNGKIVLVEAENNGDENFKAVLLYDLAGNAGAGSVTRLTDVVYARGRSAFDVITMDHNKVLICSQSLAFEIYDPSGVGATINKTESVARMLHSATELRDGRILLVGGSQGSGGIPLVEIFTPNGPSKKGSFKTLTPLSSGLAAHTATLLPNGKVVLIGGTGGASILNTVTLYDPNGNSGAGSSTSLTPIIDARGYHSAQLLSNGKILILAGTNLTGPLKSVELYDPAGAGSTTLLNPLLSDRSCFFSSNLLSNNKVLVSGGCDTNATFTNSVELYDPSGAGTATAMTPLNSVRLYHAGVTLPSGKILMIGGMDPSTGILDSVELYNPAGSGSTTNMTSLTAPRAMSNSILLKSGKILIANGMNATTITNLAELYDPSGNSGTGSIVSFTADFLKVGYNTATLMSDGRVFFYGGTDADGATSAYTMLALADSALLTPVKGTAPFTYAIESGTGSISALGIFTPYTSGATVVKVTDAKGVVSKVVVTTN